MKKSEFFTAFVLGAFVTYVIMLIWFTVTYGSCSEQLLNGDVILKSCLE